MELYRRGIEVIDVNLIYCLIPIILTLSFAQFFFKDRFKTEKALNLIRWTIIIYTIIIWIITLIEMTLYPDESAFFNRATGSYGFAYWIMFVSAMVLPFSLFVKKMASKFWYVFLVAFFMKVGFYLEQIIRITTVYHRDYLPANASIEFSISILFEIGMLCIQGVIIAIVILGIFETIKKKKTRMIS